VIASAITSAETGNMEDYRDLLNEFASSDIANNAFGQEKKNFNFQSPYEVILRVGALWLLHVFQRHVVIIF